MIKKKELNYFQFSQNFFISVLLISPFFAIYQIMRHLLYSSMPYEKINAAENILIYIFREYSVPYIFDLIIFLIGLVLFVNFKKKYNFKLNLTYMFVMLIEGVLFGILLFYLIVADFKPSPDSIYALEKFYLAIGAGIWEELLFRVFLLNVVIFLIEKILDKAFKVDYKRYSFFYLFIIISFVAILFSLIHYSLDQVNDLSNLILQRSFQLKVIGGIFLGYLYYYRGFGITCLSHIVYNFIIYITAIGWFS